MIIKMGCWGYDLIASSSCSTAVVYCCTDNIGTCISLAENGFVSDRQRAVRFVRVRVYITDISCLGGADGLVLIILAGRV